MTSFTPGDAYWWMRDKPHFQSPPHAEWRGRLPAGAIACREPNGYSMWHLLAAKALPPDTVFQFLANASEGVTIDELIDDLREVMTVFDDTWKENWYQWSGMKSNRFGWRRLQRETAFCTPLQICERLRVPLIALEPDDEWPRIHPVIEAAQMESLRRLS